MSNYKVDAGYPKEGGRDRQHVVVQAESGWILLCTKKPATHAAADPLTKDNITCKTCLDAATAMLASA